MNVHKLFRVFSVNLTTYYSIGTFLLTLIVFEASFGGGGRLIDIGWFSPRMYLFLCGISYFLYGYAKFKIKPRYEFLMMIMSFTGLTALSLLVAIGNEIPLHAIVSDLKPMAYFFSLLFFTVAIRDINQIKLVIKLIKAAALLLSILFLLIIVVWKTDFVSTEQVVAWFNPQHDPQREFIFRGDTTFFFKAVVCVGTGVFFSMNEKNNFVRLSYMTIFLLTIASTMTRGLWLSVFIVLAGYSYFNITNKIYAVLSALALIILGVLGVIIISNILPSAHDSNAIRIHDLSMFLSLFDLKGVLLGKGFGADVLGRSQIEITYVNILYKQGLLGIFFWLTPLCYICMQARKLNECNLALAMPFILSVMMVYLVSLTNPFLTNPVGMTIVLIAMVVINLLININNGLQPKVELELYTDENKLSHI